MVETFPIVPAEGRVMWVLFAIVGLILAGILVILFLSARGSLSSEFVVESGGLRLRGDLYGRFVDASRLRTDEARIVDLRQARELEPTRRTAGTAAPGYQSGWFRLRNGEKALLYLTDRSRAVYVPTTAGYSLLLSPRDPERFLASIRRLGP